MVFLEATHKLKNTLADMYKAWGDRNITLSREITKLHEETLRFTLSEAIEYFNANDPRGEFVICVQGAEKAEEPEVDIETALLRVQAYRDSGLSLKDAAKRASEETGFSKKMLYDAAVKG